MKFVPLFHVGFLCDSRLRSGGSLFLGLNHTLGKADTTHFSTGFPFFLWKVSACDSPWVSRGPFFVFFPVLPGCFIMGFFVTLRRVGKSASTRHIHAPPPSDVGR